jgi:hypothetical protein
VSRTEQQFAEARAEYAARSPWHAQNAERFEQCLREIDAEPEEVTLPALPHDWADPESKW